jgi:hypothetical protein
MPPEVTITAVDQAIRRGQAINPMPKLHDHHPAIHRGADPLLEWGDHAGAGTPGDVKSRHRVAGPLFLVAASLSPPNDREPSNALLTQPGALLASGEVDVGLRPPTWPGIDVAIESRGANPVRHRPLVRIAHAEPPLFRRIDQEKPAK